MENRSNYCQKDYKNYFIWLQKTLGIGYNLARVFSVFSSPEEIYLAKYEELKLSGVFDMSAIEKIVSNQKDGLSQVEKVILECENNNIEILTPDMSEYPSKLLEIDD